MAQAIKGGLVGPTPAQVRMSQFQQAGKALSEMNSFLEQKRQFNEKMKEEKRQYNVNHKYRLWLEMANSLPGGTSFDAFRGPQGKEGFWNFMGKFATDEEKEAMWEQLQEMNWKERHSYALNEFANERPTEPEPPPKEEEDWERLEYIKPEWGSNMRTDPEPVSMTPTLVDPVVNEVSKPVHTVTETTIPEPVEKTKEKVEPMREVVEPPPDVQLGPAEPEEEEVSAQPSSVPMYQYGNPYNEATAAEPGQVLRSRSGPAIDRANQKMAQIEYNRHVEPEDRLSLEDFQSSGEVDSRNVALAYSTEDIDFEDTQTYKQITDLVKSKYPNAAEGAIESSYGVISEMAGYVFNKGFSEGERKTVFNDWLNSVARGEPVDTRVQARVVQNFVEDIADKFWGDSFDNYVETYNERLARLRNPSEDTTTTNNEQDELESFKQQMADFVTNRK